MVLVAANAEERGPERTGGQEIRALDEREPLVQGGAADDVRRERQEHLVDEAGREPRTLGPPSERTARWPRSWSTSRAARTSRASPTGTTVVAFGRVSRSRGAATFVVTTSAPAMNAGCDGWIEPSAVRTTSSGSGLKRRRWRSSPKSAPASGNACAGVQSDRGAAFIVPEPITTPSAQARRSPITNRSLALSAAIRRFEFGTEGIATTPSSVATKLTNRRGSSKPSGPP